MLRRLLPLLLLLVACGGGEFAPDPPEADSASTPEPAPESTPPAGVEAEATPGEVTVTKLPPVGSQPAEKKKSRWLGISVGNMKEPIPGAPEDARAMIQRSYVGGPARAAGLRRGDVIVRAGAHEAIKQYQDYIGEARKVQIGETIALGVLRDGERIDVELTMIEKPGNMKTWRKRHFPGTEAAGWDVEALRPADGGRLTSAEAGDKPQVLYFWATWCGPCRKTSPQFEAAFKEHGADVAMVAISTEERDVLDPAVAASTFTYPVGRDDTGYAKWDYEVKSLPTIVLVEDGKVTAWDYGVAGIPRVLGTLAR